jgi:purine nucleosidase
MRRFLIDTDTGSDDAVALVMALQQPDIQVDAITVVSGNVGLDQAVQNALYTVELCGASTPVYRGCERPLLRPLETAQDVHGTDGMGDIGLPLQGRTPAPGHAVDVIIDTITRAPGEITLVTLGPLTNIAVALLREPSLADKVAACYTMGGTGEGHGNASPVAEYNFWADPDAAKIVFELGMPITMVGWDISRKYAVFDPDAAGELRAQGALGAFCVDIQRTLIEFVKTETKLAGFDLPDPITMAVALDRRVATAIEQLHVAIETQSDLCRGQSVVDHLGVTGHAPNIDVVRTASRAAFEQILHAAVKDA